MAKAADGQHQCSDCGEQTDRKSLRCKPCATERHRQRSKERARGLAAQRPTTVTVELHACVECGRMYETSRPQQQYCSGECRDRRRYRNGSGRTNTTTRGYGREHQKVRESWRPIVEAGEAVCCLCGYGIEPFDLWHLDHTPDRTGYRGVAHALCNVTDGARRGGRATTARRG